MSLLERAGLVRQEGLGDDHVPPSPDAPADSGAAAEPAASASAPTTDTGLASAAPVPDGQTLEQVYAASQVPACSYPAERLLRLVAGLNAMEETLRRQTIHAIDAADESWTIDDPLGDAAAKIAAIEQHASGLRAGLGQAETQAQAELAELRRKQDAAVAEVKRQIADLEGLLTREVTRGAQESAAIESALQMKKEAVSQELATLSRAAADFRGLIAQFKTNLTP
ncbi:MAG TPA: methyl-accepting chemotaxis protein [Ideonella sp.]|uniref:methyl-accepting chemotaxis protein n=1 Tax=Ideonella sp. TaxID=1929293 RepID=UPI002E3308FB|nr:methyl-accepting chemotaxis protein [Ideonella sp.]HEX5682515.1 methyl-accepting chemotaxis protein [Ideonella sp.]